ncbi:MAG TPA: peptide chain release factor N(5)-glutamine methyltransferase [Stellaceae bacterium]|jgi:release factor glutamine methyltransferase|nr:peptide chain release factor N(5)-glutamine methyltransferase [Stellaceae bacterium]
MSATEPLSPSRSFGEAVASLAPRLAAAGIAEARREARLLVALAAGVEPGAVLGWPERPLDSAAEARLAMLAARRAAREPYARLAGRRQFWSLDFTLSAATLEPRPDSETLIEAALERLPDRRAPLRILDFGTGSGCLLLALLSELPHAFGIGVDLLPEAAAIARRNAAALGLADRAAFVVGSWGEALARPVDVILANPPYICSESIDSLAPEVAHYEPRAALDGGKDGLAAYRALAGTVGRLLEPEGMAFFELGVDQRVAVAALMRGAGLRPEATRRDLAGIERVLVVARR